MQTEPGQPGISLSTLCVVDVANNCQRPLDANMEFLATPRKGSGGRGGERGGGGGGAGGSVGGGAKSKQSIPFTLPEEC